MEERSYSMVDYQLANEMNEQSDINHSCQTQYVNPPAKTRNTSPHLSSYSSVNKLSFNYLGNTISPCAWSLAKQMIFAFVSIEKRRMDISSVPMGISLSMWENMGLLSHFKCSRGNGMGL